MKPLPLVKHRRQNQRGAALIVALIFLIVLSMLGVTVANNNTLQEKMAGNTRQRDLAFQAAEQALEVAHDVMVLGSASTSPANPKPALKKYIEDVVGGVTPGALPAGLLLNGASHDNDLAYWKETFDWSASTDSVATSGMTTGLLASAPRYVVEQMPTANFGSPATTKHYYRITARGIGKSTDAVVILQTMYEFE